MMTEPLGFGDEINRKSLRRQIYEVLERRIVDGELRPGVRLAEEAVASSFAVSRSPVREAIADLERVGYAERLPNRDRRVTIPSEKFITDTFDVWNILETERLYSASRAATPALLARLEALIDAMAAESARGSSDEMMALMGEFHRLLQDGCTNEQLDRVARDYDRFVLWLRNLYFDYNSDGGMAVLEDHRRIVECFARRDRDGLRSAIGRHLLWQRDRVLEAWRGIHAAEVAPRETGSREMGPLSRRAPGAAS